MKVEDVFCSKTRLRTVKVLLQLGQLNVSEVARRLGVNYCTARKHLQILEQEGVVRRMVYGRINLYRFNHASTKAKAMQTLLETWEH